MGSVALDSFGYLGRGPLLVGPLGLDSLKYLGLVLNRFGYLGHRFALLRPQTV